MGQIEANVMTVRNEHRRQIADKAPNKTVKELAAEFGISKDTVTVILKEFGVETRGRKNSRWVKQKPAVAGRAVASIKL